MSFASIPELLDELRAGRMVVIVDDEDRENEGDLIMAAELVKPSDINFMVTHARGLVCLSLTRERCAQLGLNPMVRDNTSPHHTNFTVSIEAAEGVTTGISAADRARTVQAAVARHAKACDIVQPGHIFPIMAKPGGVLIRAGHTEAGCDLAGIAGVLAMEPEVLVMDEPKAGLDYAGSINLCSVMERLHQSGKTLVISTHDMDWVMEWADVVVAMRDGQVSACGTPAEVLLREDHAELGFARPTGYGSARGCNR